MPIALDEVAHVAALARLGLSPAELEQARGQLTAILEAVDRLQAADTSSVAPTAQVGPLRNVMRADDPRPPLPAATALANAGGRQDGGLLRVPAIQ